MSLTGYAPTIGQTANQSITPNIGPLLITGYAPSVVQAQGSPNITPDAGTLTIVGYAPTIEQTSPATKIGGDDVPERVEIIEKRKNPKKRAKEFEDSIRSTYRKLAGLDPEVADEIAQPMMEEAVGAELPAIDWKAFARDLEQVKRLMSAYQQALEDDDEESLLMLL